MSGRFEQLGTGFLFTEGPLWHPAGKFLLFSDMPGDHLRRWSQADGVATLSVSDTGGGIAPEHLPHVFERFYKVDTARAAESTGSGLGLSITKAIVERHGGTIHVSSEPGRTTFTILLPQSSVI